MSELPAPRPAAKPDTLTPKFMAAVIAGVVVSALYFGRPVLMPLALAYIMVICTAIYGIEHVAGITDPKLRSLALFGVNVVLGLLIFGLLDSGVFIKGSNRRQQTSKALAKRATVTG